MTSAQNFSLQLNNKVLVGQPVSYLSIPFALTQYGAMTIPFKYRWAPNRYIKVPSGDTAKSVFGTSESTASINIAAYIGRKWGRTRFYTDPSKTKNTTSLMLAVFAGPSLISLSASNLDSTKNTFDDPANIITGSVGGAAVIEWRSVDIGLFGGADFPLISNSGWIYRKRFWVGFGVGINLGMFTTGNSQTQN